MNPIIVVENVSKRYVQNEQRVSLRHEALQLVRRRLGHARDESLAQQFWALRDISFTVQPGETLGVVGRNGAGKSTLLRVLSGITSPTTGSVDIRGRFATLIALGAGFNPERTGRENIYLNAAIQGMAPRQIKLIMEDIIDFAELQEFIELPVKRYSTGMTARLGFSIAIHILPEIIFLDEILAVGDMAFQEKCLARIEGLRAQNRTLLFVSHATVTIRSLCTRCLWLHQGRLVMDGPSTDVLDQFEAVIMSPHVDERLAELGLWPPASR